MIFLHQGVIGQGVTKGISRQTLTGDPANHFTKTIQA